MPPSAPMPQQSPPGAYPVGHFGGPGGAPPEPPKKKTGLVVGISIAVVAVIGGVVALIVLLSGDDEPPLAGRKPQAPPTGGQAASSAPGLPGQSASSAPGLPGQPGSSAPGLPPADPGSGAAADDVAAVQKLTDDFLAAANSRDNAAFRALVCPGAPGDASFDGIPDDVVFEQNGEAVINGDTAIIPLKATNAEQSDEGAFAASKQGGQWCLSGPG
ncbi:hypothetical protein AB8O38_07480 [Saccharomonospora xinjiangensis]|uniref:hypothetical protein n=1 Tax=Saccharomonospora xinjiangensis TaxID=75294 RepID=UPI0035102A1B